MCDLSNIQRIGKAACELDMLRLQPGKCNVTSMPVVEEIWEHINDNNWVFVLNQRQSITISCPDKPDEFELLPNARFLNLAPGCTASTENVELHAQSIDNTYITAFIPEVNIMVPQLTLPPSFRFEPLHLQRIDLNQFHNFSLCAYGRGKTQIDGRISPNEPTSLQLRAPSIPNILIHNYSSYSSIYHILV
jgi:hypothetical protein